MMDNGLRTDAKLRANYYKTKGNRCNGQNQEGLGESRKKVKFLEKGFML